MSGTSVPTEYILPSLGKGGPELVLTLVGKWEQTLNKGPDFNVHWFISTSLGGSLGIYVGYHPQSIKIGRKATKTNILVGTQQVEFVITPTKDGQKAAAIIDNFYKECPVPGAEFLKLHVMINAAKPEFLEIVWQGLKTLHVKKA